MKKLYVGRLSAMFLTVALAFLLAGSVILYANDISVVIDGRPVSFGEQGPVQVDGRVLVPVRGVFEAMGFEVDWDRATRTAVLTDSSYEIRITIGQSTFTTNGESFQLDVPARQIDGHTMVPLRAPLESVGYELGWDRASSTVQITSPSTAAAAAPPAPPEPSISVNPDVELSDIEVVEWLLGGVWIESGDQDSYEFRDDFTGWNVDVSYDIDGFDFEWDVDSGIIFLLFESGYMEFIVPIFEGDDVAVFMFYDVDEELISRTARFYRH